AYPYGWYGYGAYPYYGYSYYQYPVYSGPLYRWDYPVRTSTYYPDGARTLVNDANGRAWEVPPVAAPPNNAQPIYMQVRVPPDARVWINDHETTQRGTERMFVSPPVTAGQNYTYEIKAQWKDPDGREITRTQSVNVRPGELKQIDLTTAPQPPERRQST